MRKENAVFIASHIILLAASLIYLLITLLSGLQSGLLILIFPGLAGLAGSAVSLILILCGSPEPDLKRYSGICIAGNILSVIVGVISFDVGFFNGSGIIFLGLPLLLIILLTAVIFFYVKDGGERAIVLLSCYIIYFFFFAICFLLAWSLE